MNIYTIGFTKKSAEEFFETLHNQDIKLLIDTRINNVSQLAGFAKGKDLEYFLRKTYGIFYSYRPDFAPTKELLKDWRDKKISWNEYELRYNTLIENRATYKRFMNDFKDFENVCILCSEATPEHCHRRLLCELIKRDNPEVEIKHL